MHPAFVKRILYMWHQIVRPPVTLLCQKIGQGTLQLWMVTRLVLEVLISVLIQLNLVVVGLWSCSKFDLLLWPDGSYIISYSYSGCNTGRQLTSLVLCLSSPMLSLLWSCIWSTQLWSVLVVWPIFFAETSYELYCHLIFGCSNWSTYNVHESSHCM